MRLLQTAYLMERYGLRLTVEQLAEVLAATFRVPDRSKNRRKLRHHHFLKKPAGRVPGGPRECPVTRAATWGAMASVTSRPARTAQVPRGR